MKNKMSNGSINKFFFFLGLVGVLMIFSSCTSVPKTKEINPNFLGDYNPIQLDDLVGIHQTITNKVKPLEYTMYFVPRQNTIEAYYRSGINKYVIILEKYQRDSLAAGITQYLIAYNGDNLLMQEGSENTVFSTGTVSLAWGVVATANCGETDFFTSYEYIDNKPYFSFVIKNAKDPDTNKTSTWQHLYFSPSQLETLTKQTDQNYLQEFVESLDNKAYGF